MKLMSSSKIHPATSILGRLNVKLWGNEKKKTEHIFILSTRTPMKLTYLHIRIQNCSTEGTFRPGCEEGKIPEQGDLKSPQECNLDVPEWLKESRTAVLVQHFCQTNPSQAHSWNTGSEQVSLQLKCRPALNLSGGNILQ